MINQLFSASIDSVLIADAKGAIAQENPAAENKRSFCTKVERSLEWYHPSLERPENSK